MSKTQGFRKFTIQLCRKKKRLKKTPNPWVFTLKPKTEGAVLPFMTQFWEYKIPFKDMAKNCRSMKETGFKTPYFWSVMTWHKSNPFPPATLTLWKSNRETYLTPRLGMRKALAFVPCDDEFLKTKVFLKASIWRRHQNGKACEDDTTSVQNFNV